MPGGNVNCASSIRRAGFFYFSWVVIMITVLTGARASSEIHDPESDELYARHGFLEEVEGERALNWVREQNTRSLEILKADARFKSIREDILQILKDKSILYPITIKGDWVYELWKGEGHPRGLYRRAPLSTYVAGQPEWQTVLDIDQLAQQEDKSWFLSHVEFSRDFGRALMRLSDGGKDAAYFREFDLEKLDFVEGGISLPEAKGEMEWVTRDQVLVATNFGEGSMTSSGYPRFVKLWRRGQELDQAETILEVPESSVRAIAYALSPSEDTFYMLYEAVDFWNGRYFLWRPGMEKVLLTIPSDANVYGELQGDLILFLNSDWEINDKVFVRGSVVALDRDKFLNGTLSVSLVIAPDTQRVVSSVTMTGRDLYVHLLENVNARLMRFSKIYNSWVSAPPIQIPDEMTLDFVAANAQGDELIVDIENFITPETRAAVSLDGTLKNIASRAHGFEASPFEVHQFQATSRDGTKIPYYIVGPKDLDLDGKNPTVLYGYGGFRSSLTPWYSASIGKAWLERGGVYVLANIRGGEEFGPDWHKSVLKENRQRVFDDFIAVAEDLIQRRITSPAHLGIQGGSNGGLLVGAVMVQRPELFNAVQCAVPLLDMLRYHKLLAGHSWMAEYGDPDDPEMRPYLRAYSPYHNLLEQKQYPEIFFTTSTKDDRVHPGHARKMAYRMQEMGHPFLYFERVEGGHSGVGDFEDRAEELALEWIYFWTHLERKAN